MRHHSLRFMYSVSREEPWGWVVSLMVPLLVFEAGLETPCGFVSLNLEGCYLGSCLTILRGVLGFGKLL